MAPSERCIKLGLAMSGAISAGAYTAGVLDFLIQALDEWDRHRGEPGVPDHRVLIPVMAGASAGAVTAALGSLSAARGPLPAPSDTAAPHVLPELYDAWVVQPDFVAARECGALLDPDPADGKGGIRSALSGQPLERIAMRATAGTARVEAAKAAGVPPVRDSAPTYLNDKLHLFMTLTNLRGLPYRLAFGGDERGYRMMAHADRAHYEMLTGGEGAFRSPWALADHAVPLDARALGDEGYWSGLIGHALASAAFPIGLPARDTALCADQYDRRAWPLPLTLEQARAIRPDWPDRRPATEPVPFAAVDGGALDNDPFQIVRYALMTDPPVEEPDRPDAVRRLLLMITPFPEGPVYERNDAQARDTALTAVIRRLLPTFMESARFKPQEVAQALDPANASRWLVAPRRAGGDGSSDRYALACGLLGGFGGFLHRSLREHDYQLGRRNCQRLLEGWLGLDPSNEVVRESRPLAGTPADAPRHAVIPLLGTAAEEVPLPPWPRVPADAVAAFVAGALKRADGLVPRGADQLRGLMGAVLRWGWVFKRGAAGRWLRQYVLADLIRRDQYDDPAVIARNEGERAVLAACMDPAFDFRSVAGIAADCRADADGVAGALKALTEAGLTVAVDGLQGGVTVFTAALRVPARFDQARPAAERYVALVGETLFAVGGRLIALLGGVAPTPLYRID
jgi:hypothetical protein